MKKKVNWEKVAVVTGVVASVTSVVLTIIQIRQMNKEQRQKSMGRLPPAPTETLSGLLA